jgi:uncharacterized membrane protein YesL
VIPVSTTSRRSAFAGVLHHIDVALRYLWLDMLWLLSCLPVVTAPAATAALLGVTREWAQGDDRPVLPRFAAHMRQRSALGLLVGLSLTFLGALFAVNFTIVASMDAGRRIVFCGLLAAVVPMVAVVVHVPRALLDFEGAARDFPHALVGSILCRPARAVAGTILVIALATAAVLTFPLAVLLVGSLLARWSWGLAFAHKPFHEHHTEGDIRTWSR